MNIEQLKTELREFIKLSETITPGEWKLASGGELLRNVNAGDQVICTVACRRDPHNAAFIARSRNISPTMAKMLLSTAEMLDDMPFNVADALELKLLKLWEETM